MSDEILTVEVPSGTRRRLELMGFPHDLSGRDVVRFLIEEGLGVLERHRHSEGETAPTQKSGCRQKRYQTGLVKIEGFQ